MTDDKIEAFLKEVEKPGGVTSDYYSEEVEKPLALVRCYREANQKSSRCTAECEGFLGCMCSGRIARAAEEKAKEIING